jgi:hypothetical protein
MDVITPGVDGDQAPADGYTGLGDGSFDTCALIGTQLHWRSL